MNTVRIAEFLRPPFGKAAGLSLYIKVVDTLKAHLVRG
jgi:hypothetical protein